MRRIFDSRQMPGEIIDVLVVRRGIAPQRLLPLLQAWERGRQALEHDPAAAAALLAVGTDLSEKDYLQTLKGLKLLPLDTSLRELRQDERGHSLLAAHGRLMERTLQRLQLLSRPVDWKTLIDDRALRLWQTGAATKDQP
jgi:NitT/TauT family transport system substrate-binding protein